MPTSPATKRVTLISHPGAPAPAVRSIIASVSTTPGSLTLGFELRADFTNLSIPAQAPSEPAEFLWQHTCFEAFIAVGDADPYREFNFSPSSRWAAYAFRSYREREATSPVLSPPRITVAHFADVLTLQAWLPAAAIPRCQTGQQLRLGLAAVIESRAGELSYWAANHPGPKPDFHQRAGFVLELPPLHR